MNKFIKYIMFTYLLTFLFIFNVKAECSYQERKEMLNIAKNVDISIEPIEVTAENGKYDFKFYITGIEDKIFVKYYNTNNGKENFITNDNLSDGIYSFLDENSLMVYNYKFIFLSNNDNCPGHELYTKTIKKPMYNLYSENVNCENEEFENFKYCKKFLEKDYKLTNDKFYDEIFKYNLKLSEIIKNTNETQENNKLNIIIISIVISIVLLMILLFIIMSIRKKRNQL